MIQISFSRIKTRLLSFCLLFTLISTPVLGKVVSRTALVIGNSDYKTTPLKNPLNDARDMADALSKNGFQVVLLENADRSQMRRSIREFEEILGKNKGVGLFYFAGHGIQLKGKNYLVPIGADILKEYEVPDETIQADAVLQAMDYANNELNIVILDACRNNPFPRSFRSASRGLARMETMGSGMLIAYATSPGAVALDGEGDNGIYTKHLLQAMNTAGLSIEQVFKQVRQKVMQETNMNQTPWEESSLTGDFYFIATDNARININNVSSAPASSFSRQNQEEVMFWQGISASKKQSDYETYLKKYPDGVFTELARSRIASMRPSHEKQQGTIQNSEKEILKIDPSALVNQVTGKWRHTYKENNKECYLKFTFLQDGDGNAQGEESDDSWWASPFHWKVEGQVLIIQYKDLTEKYRIVSIDDKTMILDTIEGEAKGEKFSMQKVPVAELTQDVPFQEKLLTGSWKETWEEDGKAAYLIFTFRSDGSVLEIGQTPSDKWSQESRWKLTTDNILQILGDEKQEYRIINITTDHMDVIDLSPQYMGEGTRFYKVENKK